MKTLKHSISLCIVCLLLCGCSVGMALSGKEEPNLDAIHVGSTRGEIELHLGSPVETTVSPNGKRVDIYEYEIGNEPSAGRAAIHGAMDILTIGLWEIVGTPVEGFQGEKRRIAITYDSEDKCCEISRASN